VSNWAAMVRREGRLRIQRPSRNRPEAVLAPVRRYDDAVHGDREGQPGVRGGRAPEREGAHLDGSVQRGAEQGRDPARRRGPPGERQGRTRAALGPQAHRDRRAVQRDQGADRRLLDLAGQVEGGGDRVGEAHSRRGVPQERDRDRDPAGVRGRRFRPRLHPRAQGSGRAPAHAREPPPACAGGPRCANRLPSWRPMRTA